MALKNETKNIDIKAISEGLTDFRFPVSKQVVRTTFRLSQNGHDAIKNLSDLWSKKNNEVFDEILEFYDVSKKTQVDLSSLFVKDTKYTLRKTYVLNKNTLAKIRKIANQEKITRDLFIDKMAILYELAFNKKLRKKHEIYSKTHKEIIKPFWHQAEDIEKKLIEELGKDDPVVTEFGLVVTTIMDFKHFLEKSF